MKALLQTPLLCSKASFRVSSTGAAAMGGKDGTPEAPEGLPEALSLAGAGTDATTTVAISGDRRRKEGTRRPPTSCLLLALWIPMSQGPQKASSGVADACHRGRVWAVADMLVRNLL